MVNNSTSSQRKQQSNLAICANAVTIHKPKNLRYTLSMRVVNATSNILEFFSKVIQ